MIHLIIIAVVLSIVPTSAVFMLGPMDPFIFSLIFGVLSLSGVLLASIFINFIIMAKVPFIPFLESGRAGRILLIRPDERRRLSFKIGFRYGALARTKEGFYNIDPEDVWIEEKSKCACAMVYGQYSSSINPKEADGARRLKELGLSNNAELTEWVEENPDAQIEILGKSMNAADVHKFYNRNDRADTMEAEHEFRIAQMEAVKKDNFNKFAQIIIVISIMLICAAVAVAIINSMVSTNAAVDSAGIGNQLNNLANVITQQQVAQNSPSGTAVI